MSYSTSPVRDQIRHQDALDWGEKMREHREKLMYDETIELAAKGDYTRLYEAMDYQDNDRVVFEALRTCATSGSLAAQRAIKVLATTYATLFSEPA